jgi:hypothetical protein
MDVVVVVLGDSVRIIEVVIAEVISFVGIGVCVDTLDAV